MGRPQERDERVTREPGLNRIDHDVNRGCNRLSGKRQGVRQVVRHAGSAKCVWGQIQVRKGMLENNGGTVEVGLALTLLLEPPCDGDQLLFAVAAGVPQIG